MRKKNTEANFFTLKDRSGEDIRFRELTLSRALELLTKLSEEGENPSTETKQIFKKTEDLVDTLFREFWGESEPLSSGDIFCALREFGIDEGDAIRLVGELVEKTKSRMEKFTNLASEKKD